MRKSAVIALIILFAANLAGCATDRAQSAGFVDTSIMHDDPATPFQLEWKKPGFDKSGFTKIYIADVNTSYMLSQTNWQEGMRAGEMKEDVKKIADYTRDAVKKAFREDPNARFKVLDAPTKQPDTLVLEIAIVEVVPSKVILNAMGYAPFGIGLGIKAVRMMAKDQSSIAIEARVRNAATNEIVATFADRRVEQSSATGVRGLTWYSHIDAIIDAWASEFVKIANRKPGETVKGMARFTLKPW